MIDKTFLTEKCKEFGVEITPTVADKLDIYAEFLVEYNENVNLTAITDPEGIAIKHFADSLVPFAEIEHSGLSVIDVGTGAGFPSVPLKTYDESIKLTLLDSLNKRIVFLQKLCEKMGLKDVKFVHGRAEEVGRKPEFREKYDIATARAVASLRELAEYCLPFVKVGGIFVSLKGGDCEAEIDEAKNAIKLLGGKIIDVKKYKLSDDASRSVIIIQKVSQTPPKYPRQSAKIAKSPL